MNIGLILVHWRMRKPAVRSKISRAPTSEVVPSPRVGGNQIKLPQGGRRRGYLLVTPYCGIFVVAEMVINKAVQGTKIHAAPQSFLPKGTAMVTAESQPIGDRAGGELRYSHPSRNSLGESRRYCSTMILCKRGIRTLPPPKKIIPSLTQVSPVRTSLMLPQQSASGQRPECPKQQDH